MNENVRQMVPSGIRRFTALAKTVPDCVMLTLGEPEFDTPEPIRQAAAQAISDGLTHYAPNRGTDSLRTAIARHETKRGFPCGPENILITVGATGALNTAISCLLKCGDEIVIPTPAFSLYESIAASIGAKPVLLDLSKTGYQITEEALGAVLTPRTRAVVLNSPNNPTGVVFSQSSLDVVERAVAGKPIFVLCDNVYAPLCPKPIPDLTLRETLRSQLILCQSFSKPWAMTGWRIGYLAAPAELVDSFVLLQAAQIASVPTFVQKAAECALTVPVENMANCYALRRQYAMDRLTDMGLPFPKPEGAFYLFPDITAYSHDSEDFCTRLIREAGVACVPGSCFSGEGHIRVSCCASQQELEAGLTRLQRFLQSY